MTVKDTRRNILPFTNLATAFPCMLLCMFPWFTGLLFTTVWVVRTNWITIIVWRG